MGTTLFLLACAASLGYLAQVTGLCTVRAVSDWMNRRRIRLIAITVSGFWIYAFLPFAEQAGAAERTLAHYPHWGFALGGLLFGLGAAGNGACSISTATRLASGDLRMIATMFGWLGGWLLSPTLGFQPNYQPLHTGTGWVQITALAGLILGTGAMLLLGRPRFVLWSGIMLVGVLSGALFQALPHWTPSDFLQNLSFAIIDADPERLPDVETIMVLMLMLLGMWFGGWRHGRFRLRLPRIKELVLHGFSGILMGFGSAIALGGNDYQLLIALPAISPGGALTLLAICTGIVLGLVWIPGSLPPLPDRKRPAAQQVP